MNLLVLYSASREAEGLSNFLDKVNSQISISGMLGFNSPFTIYLGRELGKPEETKSLSEEERQACKIKYLVGLKLPYFLNRPRREAPGEVSFGRALLLSLRSENFQF